MERSQKPILVWDLGGLKDRGGYVHEVFLEKLAGGIFSVYSTGNSFDGAFPEPLIIGNIEAVPASEFKGSKIKSESEILIGIGNNGKMKKYSLKALEDGELKLDTSPV